MFTKVQAWKTLEHRSFGKVKITEYVLMRHKVPTKILNRRKMRQQGMEEKGLAWPFMVIIFSYLYHSCL